MNIKLILLVFGLVIGTLAICNRNSGHACRATFAWDIKTHFVKSEKWVVSGYKFYHRGLLQGPIAPILITLGAHEYSSLRQSAGRPAPPANQQNHNMSSGSCDTNNPNPVSRYHFMELLITNQQSLCINMERCNTFIIWCYQLSSCLKCSLKSSMPADILRTIHILSAIFLTHQRSTRSRKITDTRMIK